MKRILITFIAISVSMMLFAQQLKVKNNTVDVGQIVYRQPVTAVFDINNTEGHTVYIEQIETSCGCTTTEIPSQSIPANGKVSMKVTYDAKLMGHFEKQIYVKCREENKPLELTLKGVVVDRVSEYQGAYDHQLGTLLTNIRDVDFGDVTQGEMPTIDIHVKNATDKPLSPVVMHRPSYLVAETSPTTIPPGKTGVVRLILASQQVSNYGQLQDKVYLGDHPGDRANNNKSFNVNALILPNVQQKAEADLSRSAHLTLSESLIDFTNVDGKSKKSVTLTLTNTGVSELHIYDIQVNGEGMKVSLPKSRLKPGENTKFKISADSKQLVNMKTEAFIQMITNDPQHVKVVLPVKVR